uniref:Uncharacterized protein n=1 Tax=Rhizophagus irregularis (strain DAOM 181602 / DAOM 197198 / MUCL 43194) TaxID=747089 RepID=U9UGU7_RHIID
MDSFTNSNKKLFNSSHINANEELYEICEICSYTCYAKRFQHYFENWTSGNNDIDKFIQDTQSSIHKFYDIDKTLEWIPYERFYNIKHIEEGRYKFNWVDGNIIDWDNKTQSWKRKGQNMSVELKILSNPINISLEFMDEINKTYGITQNPITNNYMMVLSNKCKECNDICYANRFQLNFKNWTSENNDIDKFIRDTQLSTHADLKKALEWIPYSKLNDIRYITVNRDRANWVDGNIIDWVDETKGWKRGGQNMIVELKKLNDLKNITLEFMDEV